MDLPITHEEQAAAQRRFARVLLGLVVTYFLATFLFSEFWPFSRFPMFSRSGRPWTRGLLRELSPAELEKPLLEVWEKELPGVTVPLSRLHKNQDDLSTVVGKVKDGKLSPEQQAFLAGYFAEARATRRLVLYTVRGAPRPDRSVRVRFRPIALLGPEGVTPLQTPSDSDPKSTNALPTPAATAVPAAVGDAAVPDAAAEDAAVTKATAP